MKQIKSETGRSELNKRDDGEIRRRKMKRMRQGRSEESSSKKKKNRNCPHHKTRPKSQSLKSIRIPVFAPQTHFLVSVFSGMCVADCGNIVCGGLWYCGLNRTMTVWYTVDCGSLVFHGLW